MEVLRLRLDAQATEPEGMPALQTLFRETERRRQVKMKFKVSVRRELVFRNLEVEEDSREEFERTLKGGEYDPDVVWLIEKNGRDPSDPDDWEDEVEEEEDDDDV